MRLATLPSIFPFPVPRDLAAAMDLIGQPVGGFARGGFPAYDLVTDEKGATLSFAVAGFTEKDLTVELENGTLTVSGRKEAAEDAPGTTVVYRGIARRSFKRVFTLADGVEVANATLDNGVLELRLNFTAPERNVQKIEIARAA